MVEWALNEGLRVAIATNPVYSLAAIEQRLEWAEISPREFDFAVVPSIDTVHFGKPQPEYYSELIARLRVRPDEVLVVGDDWKNDIEPASAAGVNTFWIAPRDAPRPASAAEPAGQGTLYDFLRWARDARCLDTLQPLPTRPSALMAGLNGNLAEFYTAAHAVTDWRLSRPRANGL